MASRLARPLCLSLVIGCFVQVYKSLPLLSTGPNQSSSFSEETLTSVPLSSTGPNRSSFPEETSTTNVLPRPYRIIQIGSPRTGSTFQFHLLDAIVSLKSPADAIVARAHVREWKDYPVVEDIAEDKSFVLKTHRDDPMFESLQQRGSLAVFSSSADIAPYALYTQNREELVECPLCEIDRYRSMFRLSADDVKLLRRHMTLYSVLRKCCGEQMSKYETLRLNGCNVTQFVELPDYPHCEDMELEETELKFAAGPTAYHPLTPEFTWAKPGDCARFRKIIASGKGFNGRPLRSCEIDGKFAGQREKGPSRTNNDKTGKKKTGPPEKRSGSKFAGVEINKETNEEQISLSKEWSNDGKSAGSGENGEMKINEEKGEK